MTMTMIMMCVLPCPAGLQGDRALVWVDQHIKPRWLPLSLTPYRTVVPTLVILKFRAMPDGRPVIYEQL